MIEELHEMRRALCRHCGLTIVLYSGDLSGERWHHKRDGEGTRFCQPLQQAEPAAPTESEER